MPKILALLIFCFFLTDLSAQATFQTGYYITNSEETITGFIKNMDWGTNPTEFEFRKNESSQPEILSIDNVKEFGIYDYGVFIRQLVSIELSSYNLNVYRNQKDPEFQDRTLFLKVLVDGDTDLLVYQDGSLQRFFYRIESERPIQLIHRVYELNGKLVSNNSYRVTLQNKFQCSRTKSSKNLNYNSKDLIPFFENYNECINSDFITHRYKTGKSSLSFTLLPGINYSSLEIYRRSFFGVKRDFDSNFSFTVASEIEIKTPFNHGNVAFYLRPSYQTYRSSVIYDVGTEFFEVLREDITKYNSVKFPIGIRYYKPLSIKSSLYLNSHFGYDYVFDSYFERNSQSRINYESGFFLSLGAGLKYNNRWSLEFSWMVPRNLVASDPNWNSTFNSSSLRLGYSLFN